MCRGAVVLRLVCKKCGKEIHAVDKGKPCPVCGSAEQEWKQEYSEGVAYRRGA